MMLSSIFNFFFFVRLFVCLFVWGMLFVFMNHSFQLDYGRKKTPSLASEYGMCEFNMLSLNYISPLFGLYDYLLECWFVCSFIINLKLIFFLL